MFMSEFVFQYYVFVCLVTFASYAYDKLSAVRGFRRVPELRLQLLALFGGWPGALLGQMVFRHKTAKRSFQVWFWIVAFANVCVTLGLAQLFS